MGRICGDNREAWNEKTLYRYSGIPSTLQLSDKGTLARRLLRLEREPPNGEGRITAAAHRGSRIVYVPTGQVERHLDNWGIVQSR